MKSRHHVASRNAPKMWWCTWASNLNPGDIWDLCEGCQVDFIGGKPEEVVSITDKDRLDSNGGNNTQVDGDTQQVEP